MSNSFEVPEGFSEILIPRGEDLRPEATAHTGHRRIVKMIPVPFGPGGSLIYGWCLWMGKSFIDPASCKTSRRCIIMLDKGPPKPDVSVIVTIPVDDLERLEEDSLECDTSPDEEALPPMPPYKGSYRHVKMIAVIRDINCPEIQTHGWCLWMSPYRFSDPDLNEEVCRYCVVLFDKGPDGEAPQPPGLVVVPEKALNRYFAATVEW